MRECRHTRTLWTHPLSKPHKKALKKRNVNYILPWVQESRRRIAFEKTLHPKKRGKDTSELQIIGSMKQP